MIGLSPIRPGNLPAIPPVEVAAARLPSSAPCVPDVTADTQAEDGIVAFIELVEQHRDVGGIILQVAIEHGDDRTPCGHDARVHRRALAGVPFETNKAVPRIVLNSFRGAIARTVIDKNDLVSLANAIEMFFDRGIGLLEDFFLVE